MRSTHSETDFGRVLLARYLLDSAEQIRARCARAFPMCRGVGVDSSLIKRIANLKTRLAILESGETRASRIG